MAKKDNDKFSSADSYISMVLGLAVVLLIGSIAFNYLSKNKNKGEVQNAETTQEKQQTSSLPDKHTVQKGETLWSISEKYYHSGYNWVDIAKANKLANANLIENGQKLVIPEADPIIPKGGEVSSAQRDNKPKNSKVTIAKGDTLWKIALTQYDNGYRWVDIAKANNLSNPNMIHVGNTLKMP